MKKIRNNWKQIKQSKKRKILYILTCVLVFLCMTVVPLGLWLTSGMMNIGITSIRGNSMAPTFLDGQVLYVQPAQYERGEIVVVNCTNTGDYSVDGLSLLKRIIGLPGENIEITEEGVLLDGELLDESAYTDNQNLTLQESNDIEELVLSDNEYFLLGDNRDNSFDSRHIGAIHSKDFLYGLTTEPNDYTREIWKNVIVVAMMNLFVILASPFLLSSVFAWIPDEERKKLRLQKKREREVRKSLKKWKKDSAANVVPKRAKKYVKKKK